MVTRRGGAARGLSLNAQNEARGRPRGPLRSPDRRPIALGMVSAGPLHDTLLELAAAMRAAEDDWWVIGSAAVALLGAAPGEVADVDVLLSAADARRVLGSLGIEARPGAANSLFRSALF